MTMIEIGREAKKASRELARLSTKEKNDLLVALAEELKVKEEEILQANEEDLRRGKEGNLSEALLDRLLLNPQRIESMIEGILSIRTMEDPHREGVVHEDVGKWSSDWEKDRPFGCGRNHL